MNKTVGRWIVTCLLLINISPALAQETHNPDPRGWGLGVFTGTLLPMGIPGVLDQLSHWGVRLSHPIRRSQLEWNGVTAKAEDVTYYLGFVSLRNPIRMDGFVAHWLVGLDFHNYKRAPTKLLGKTFPFRLVQGWHVGFGGRVPLTDRFSLRSDFRLGFSPGQQLLVGLGFEYIWN